MKASTQVSKIKCAQSEIFDMLKSILIYTLRAINNETIMEMSMKYQVPISFASVIKAQKILLARNMHTCMCMYTCVYAYMCMYVCLCVYIYIHTCMHACINTYMHVCINHNQALLGSFQTIQIFWQIIWTANIRMCVRNCIMCMCICICVCIVYSIFSFHMCQLFNLIIYLRH